MPKNWGQLNRAMQNILRYLQSQQLIKSRHEGAMERIQAQMGGYKELSEQKYGEQSKLIAQRLAGDIVKMDPMRRHQSQIALAQQRGLDTGPLVDKARADADRIAGYVVQAVKGKAGVKETSDAAMLLSEETMRIITGKGAEEIKSIREAKTEAEKARLRGEEVEVRREEVAVGKRQTQDQYYKMIHDKKIAPLQSFLNKFVKVKGQKPQNIRMLEGIIDMLGKPELKGQAEEVMEGSITPQNLLRLKQKVDQMDTKALKQRLDDKDYAWLSKVYDLFAMQKEFEFVPGVTPFAEAPGVSPFVETAPEITPEVPPPTPTDNTEAKIQYLIQQLIQNNVPPADAERIAREQFSGSPS